MVTSWLTWSGASVGVSISTQRRMPSRMVEESKGFEDVVVSMLSPSQEFNHRYSPTWNYTSAEASSAYQCSGRRRSMAQARTLLAQWLFWIRGSLAQQRLSQGAAILSQFWRADAPIAALANGYTLQRLSGPSRTAICSTISTMLRRSLASLMRVNARVSARPSEVARKSET